MNIPAEATREASKLLDQAWASPFGVDIPVDPIHIAQSLGIEVFTADLEPGIAGLLVKRQGQDAAVYLNSRDSRNRQRFTAAHELGHYVRRSTGTDEAWDYVDRRDELSSLGTDVEERFANAFAAQLLMPEHEVRSMSKRMTPPAMAVKFGVSLEALKNRLTTLRIDV